jgi:hypothetical protein
MEKQIEEMAIVLCNHCAGKEAPCSIAKSGKMCQSIQKEAQALYTAGYRKQSEGEWKQTEEPMGWHDVDCVECSACGESWVLNDNLDFDLINEYWHYCPNCGAKMKGGE